MLKLNRHDAGCITDEVIEAPLALRSRPKLCKRTFIVKRAGVVLAALVFAACLAVSVGYYAAYGQHNLDSDISSEFVLADLLNEEGRLITDSWYYSTEIRVVSPVPVYQLMLRLFGSWHIARTVSIAVLLLGVAASLLYLARGAGCSMTAALLCAGALVLPISAYQSFTLVYGGFYTVWVMLTFVQLGLVLRMDRKRLREPVLLALLGFLGGLGGVRMLMLCAAPLLAACAVLFFLDARRCGSLREAVALPAARIALGGVLLAAATLAGYAVNEGVLAQQYAFTRYDETTLLSLTPETFVRQLLYLVSFLGYRSGVLLLSREGLFSVMALLLPALGAAAMVALLRAGLSARERALALFMPAALLSGMLINALTLSPDQGEASIYCVSYYMPAALLLVFALFWALDRLAPRLRALCAAPMLALVAVFLTGNLVYREWDMRTWPTELEDVAQILTEEGATQGYATFWNANVLTELTDGRIEVFTVEDWDSGDMDTWLQRTDHLERTPEGRVFAIFTTGDLYDGTPGCREDHLIYCSDELAVVLYDSDEEFQAARWGE